MECNYQPFFALLRLAMTGEQFDSVQTAEEWSEFYQMAGIQSVTGCALRHHAGREKHGTLRRVMEGRLRHLKLMRFDF